MILISLPNPTISLLSKPIPVAPSPTKSQALAAVVPAMVCPFVGIITVPLPFLERVMLPFVFVDEIVFPSKNKLSTVSPAKVGLAPL